MPINAQAADGSLHEFPDNTDPSVIDRVMKQYAQTFTNPASRSSLPGTGAHSPLASFWDTLISSAQGVSPYAAGKAALAPEHEQFIYSETGNVSDPRKFFVGRDPQTGKQAVFQRGPQSDEGYLARLGRMFTLAQPEGFAAPAARAASEGVSRLQEFQKAGVTPNIASVGGGETAKRLSQVARVIPGIGGNVARATQRTAKDIGSGVEAEAAKLAPAQTVEDTAVGADQGIHRFISDNKLAKENYQALDMHMHGAPLSTVPATRAVAADINRRFSDLTELNGFFATPIARKVLGATEPRSIPAQNTGVLDAAGRPIVRPASVVTRQVNWKDLKELRSEVGYRLRNLGFSANPMVRGQLRRLYAALTSDMKAIVATRGPRAKEAFTRATLDYRERMQTIEKLAPIVRQDNPDRTLAILNQSAKALPTGGASNLPLLRSAKKALNTQEWADFGAAIIRNLGGLSGAFSIDRFISNWNRLSLAAKKLIFSPEAVDSLDRLARVAGYHQQVGRFENISRSGEMVVTAGFWDRVLHSVLHGGVAFAKASATLGTGYVAAKIMMSPAFARWLYKVPSIVSRAPNQTVALSRATTALRMILQGQSLTPPAPKVGEAGPSGGKITDAETRAVPRSRAAPARLPPAQAPQPALGF